MSHGRVDTHHHALPPAYRNWLIEKGLYKARPVNWSIPRTLAMMDEHRIQTAVLSVAPIGLHLDAADQAPKAREVNEFAAEVVKERPDRFGFFATLPLPNVDAALEEIRVAYDELGADGVLIPTNVHGRYLGDAEFEPVFEELDRRSAVIFTHPTGVGGQPAPGIPSYVADYLLDTVRSAIDLVRTGRTQRFRNLKIILSHGGGFVPFAAHRMGTAPVVWGDMTTEQVVEEFRTFYFDTALTASPSSLPSLLAFARPGHVLFGSDWPFAEEEIPYYTGHLDSYAMSDEERAGVNYANAQQLIPRIA